MGKLIIGFSKSKSPWKVGSKAIQVAEKRNFSHAYIRYTCFLTGIDIVAQASGSFVNEMNYDIFKEHNVVVEEYELGCTEKQYLDVLKFIRSNLGREYSKLQILFIAIKKLLKQEVQTYNKDKQFICSEFAARICQIVGIQIEAQLDYYTPSDLNTLVKNINLQRIL